MRIARAVYVWQHELHCLDSIGQYKKVGLNRLLTRQAANPALAGHNADVAC